jgi:hypothetical protein
MPCAASVNATNYVYNVAKPDGQTVVINNAAPAIRAELPKSKFLSPPMISVI